MSNHTSTDCETRHPHREAKKNRTRAAIENYATQLVLERGMDNVTIEDICTPADISKRTFFNYFSSKEEAVLGKGPKPFSKETQERFLSEEHQNLIAALITFATEEFRANVPLIDWEIERRRKKIKEKDTELLVQHQASFHAIHKQCQNMILTYIQEHPEKKTTSLTDKMEARLIVMAAIMTLSHGSMLWEESGDSDPLAAQFFIHQSYESFVELLPPAEALFTAETQNNN